MPLLGPLLFVGGKNAAAPGTELALRRAARRLRLGDVVMVSSAGPCASHVRPPMQAEEVSKLSMQERDRALTQVGQLAVQDPCQPSLSALPGALQAPVHNNGEGTMQLCTYYMATTARFLHAAFDGRVAGTHARQAGLLHSWGERGRGRCASWSMCIAKLELLHCKA